MSHRGKGFSELNKAVALATTANNNVRGRGSSNGNNRGNDGKTSPDFDDEDDARVSRLFYLQLYSRQGNLGIANYKQLVDFRLFNGFHWQF